MKCKENILKNVASLLVDLEYKPIRRLN
jgi:hypothetical protein